MERPDNNVKMRIATTEQYTAFDGVHVMHVDTNGIPEDGEGPIIRIYLNDEVIYENPPLPE